MPWFISLLIGLALQVIGYLLMPKPPKPKPPSLEDYEDPTAEAGRPIPVAFGSLTISGLNVLWFGDKEISTREEKVSKK